MLPSGDGFQRGRTRMPVRIAAALPASTAWSMALVAPSSRTSAQANGVCSGCFGRGFSTQAHVVTTPPGPTGHDLGERLAALRVVLDRRREHAAVRSADPDQALLGEAREERAQHRPDRPAIGILQDVRRREARQIVLCHVVQSSVELVCMSAAAVRTRSEMSLVGCRLPAQPTSAENHTFCSMNAT